MFTGNRDFPQPLYTIANIAALPYVQWWKFCVVYGTGRDSSLPRFQGTVE
jgi:hypothetical protein